MFASQISTCIFCCTDARSDPETAGRSLEEIDEIFAASKSIFDPVRIAKSLPKQPLSTFLVEETKRTPKLKDAVQNIEHISNASDEEDKKIEDIVSAA